MIRNESAVRVQCTMIHTRSVRSKVGFGIAAAAIALSSANAQLSPGTRVRIHGEPHVIGRYIGRRADTVFVLNGLDDTLRSLVRARTRIERLVGSQRATARGFGIGALLGAAAGVFVGGRTYRKPQELSFTRDQSKLLGAIIAFPIGGLIGGIAGHRHVVEQWDRVDH